MSLYLKYRPQNFASVVGQQHVVTTLENALRHDSLTHAYLFAGPRGTGKTSLARIIAKGINCTRLTEEGEPCNECSICKDINKGRLVDLIEIDAASNRGIDEIRDLKEKILFAPTHAKKKVYIIDEVHMLTKEAFNALLKTLEEPPDHAYFILATTEAHKIPETIISRCQLFNFKRITSQDIVLRLEKIAQSEGVDAESEALILISKMANGGLRDAIGMFEQMTLDNKIEYERVAVNLGLSGTLLVESFFNALITQNTIKALEILNDINHQGKNLNQFAGEVISFLREQMLINIENKEQLKVLMGLVEIFSDSKLQISQSFIPQLPLEIAIIKACILGEGSTTPSIESEKVKDKKVTPTPSLPEKEIKKEVVKTESPLSNDEEGGDEISLANIKGNWKRVSEKVITPFIRVSLLDGEPVKFENGELHLAFKSSSLMEKIENIRNQAEVQNAFEAVFKRKIILHFTLNKLNLKPVTETPEKADAPSMIEMANEVFGD
ncbi:DNA polymerase III subunit gamma/tau [Candidatus Peregrinibacteria bacterium CG_4_10_14_0_2_um_filter_43_11]|nr:MAG: DNA polymerase III subunit gamma/tau [Candidatus Peregrinibacteria bacterium CG_4_10_14_0_2_um_filter_43_11]